MKSFIRFVLAALLTGVAYAQSPGTYITSLPAASTLTGSELLPSAQSGSGAGCFSGYCGVAITPGMLRTYIGIGAPTTGNSGGIPFYNTANTIGSSASLLQWAPIVGGGAGGAPQTTASSGTTTTVLHGNASGLPSYAAVNLATDVSSTLPAASGGTGVSNTSTITLGGNITTSGPVTFANNTANTITFTPSSSANVNATLPPGTSNLGYLGIPQNSQAGAYTTVLADSGKEIYNTDASANTLTIAANGSVAYPIGTFIVFTNCPSCGTLTVAINSDTMYWVGGGTVTLGSTGSRTLAAFATVACSKKTSTTWYCTGGAGVT